MFGRGRGRNIPVNGTLLKAEALKALQKVKEDDSMALNGLLDSLATRLKTKIANLHTESVDVCTEGAEQ